MCEIASFVNNAVGTYLERAQQMFQEALDYVEQFAQGSRRLPRLPTFANLFNFLIVFHGQFLGFRGDQYLVE